MAHNKDRRPTYPTENKKHHAKSIIDLLKNGWNWLCFAFVVVVAIYIVYKIPYTAIKRYYIEKSPVTTEAVITQIGKSTQWVGAPVYYDFYVGDSLYHGIVMMTSKQRKAKNTRVDQTINITYEKDNPSNSMYGKTRSQWNEFPFYFQ